MYYPKPPIQMPQPMGVPPMRVPPMRVPPMRVPMAAIPKSSDGGAIILFLLVILLMGTIAGYFLLQNNDEEIDNCNGNKTSLNCNNDNNCSWDVSSMTCKASLTSSDYSSPSTVLSAPLPPPVPPEEIEEVYGCMISEANNYNPDATIEDDSCTFDSQPSQNEIIIDTTPDKLYCRQDQKISCTSNPPQKVPDPESCLPNTDSLSLFCTNKGDEPSCLEKVGYGGPLCSWDSSTNMCDINQNNANVGCNMIFKAGDPSKCLSDTDNDLSVVEKCERIMVVDGEEDLCSQVVLGQETSETGCTSIMSSSDESVPACSYTMGNSQPLCFYTPPTDPRCNCEDCPEGYHSSIDFVGDDKALNDRFAMSTTCELIPLGELKCSSGQRVKHPNDNGEENFSCSDGLCVCEDCPEENYGCPVNIQNKRDPTMQPSSECEHETDKVKDSTATTKCYRRKCSAELTSENTYEKMVKNGNVYSCEPCEVVNDIPYVSDGSEVSPDFALDEHLSECEISNSETDRFADYCGSNSEFNESSWSFPDYMEWSNSVYNDISNKSSWLPNHEELKNYSGNWCPDCRNNYVITKNGVDKNMTNKDVYYGSLTTVPNEFKYSYLNDNGQWIHLCDCKYDASDIQSASNADYSNGFTNCKCSKSQYVDITSSISDKNNLNCNVIDSPCWKEGNFWYSPKKDQNALPLVSEPFKFISGMAHAAGHGAGQNLFPATGGVTTHGHTSNCGGVWDAQTDQEVIDGCRELCKNTNGCTDFFAYGSDVDGDGDWVHNRKCCLKQHSEEEITDMENGNGIVFAGTQSVRQGGIGIMPRDVYGPSQLIPGAFWNIMDPYCSFLSGDGSGQFDLDDRDIVDRCCIGCNHKVYKDGIVGDDNEYEMSGTLPPSYANNWLDLVNVDAPGLSPMVFNKTDDPIFAPSSSLDGRDVHDMPKINLRKHDKSIGFNSRPVFFYPDFRHQIEGVSPDSLYANYNSVSDIDFHVSKNIINGAAEARHGGDSGSTDLANRKDPKCVNQGASQCDVEQNYNIMTKNIFTCNRTNPLPLINKSSNVLNNGGKDISPSQWDNFDTSEWDDPLRKYYVPPFTVVGDETFYNVTASGEQKSMYLTNYDLEYPGRGWIPNDAVGIEFTNGMNKWNRTGPVNLGVGKNQLHDTACRGTPGTSPGNGLGYDKSDLKNNWDWARGFSKSHGTKHQNYKMYIDESPQGDTDAPRFIQNCNAQKTYKYGQEHTCWGGESQATSECNWGGDCNHQMRCLVPWTGYNNTITRINGYQKDENKNVYNKEKSASSIIERPSAVPNTNVPNTNVPNTNTNYQGSSIININDGSPALSIKLPLSDLIQECSGQRRIPNCGVRRGEGSCNGYTTSGAPQGQGYQCVWSPRGSCDSWISGKKSESLCTLPS